MDSIYSLLRSKFPEAGSLKEIQPVAYAYLGDTLFDLFIRTALVSGENISPHEMHIAACHYACCKSQAKIAELLLDELSEEEKNVLKHARNQKSISPPRNSDPVDYKWATGLECLFGYLFIKERDERLFELMQKGIKALDDFGESKHE